jgi:hypothetical protein
LVGPFNPTPGAYYHGSRSGLPPGTILLPARERGDRRSELSNAKAGYDQFAHHPDFVFVTNDACLALAFAGRRPKPAVYEVEPIDELAEDEDAPGQSWMCARAKIVRQVPVPAAVLRELTARTIAGYDVRDNVIWLGAVFEGDEAAA